MAWHRQLSGASIARQTSSSALLAHDATPSHNSSGANSRGSTSERIATPIRQETVESEEGFDPCPSTWYRQAKQTGGLGGAWRLAFMCLCLPLCYPCYITRKFRRRRRASTGSGGTTSPNRAPLSPSISQVDVRSSPAKDAKQALRVDAMFLQVRPSDMMAFIHDM